MAARHSVNGGKPSTSAPSAGSKRDKGTTVVKGMGATPHQDILAYAKGVHHAKTPTRGNTRTLSR